MRGPKTDKENDLLVRVSKGELPAFDTLYECYFKQLRFFALSMISDQAPAEDIATEAFISLLNSRRIFESSEHIKSYLFLTVKHQCINYLQANKRHARAHRELQFIGEHSDSSVERQLVLAEIMQGLYEEISALPPQSGQVFRLIFFDGLSTAEVSERMGISKQHVLNQKSNAVRQIRTALLKKGMLSVLVWLDLIVASR